MPARKSSIAVLFSRDLADHTKSALPQKLELGDIDREYFTGEERWVTGKNGKRKRQCNTAPMNTVNTVKTMNADLRENRNRAL